MSEENKAVGRRYLEAVNERDLNIIDEVIAPDYVGHEPGEETRGPEGVKQYISMFLDAFPDVSITVEDEIAEGDKVVIRFTGRGTHQGELMGIPPSGNRVEVSSISICRFEGGKVIEEWEQYDALGMMQQIGAVPPPEQE
jgi:steroid delta-isomerase-like uncharacterized protein